MDKVQIRRSLCKFGLKLYDHRSDIAFGAGLVGTIAGAILIGKSSYKQAEINKEHVNEKEEIEKTDAPEEKAEALKVLNRKTMKKTVKNYALAVSVETAAIGANVYSYASKSSQYAELLMGYQAISTLYEAVKARVIASEGENKWIEYENGLTTCDIANLKETDEDGNPTIKEEDYYAQKVGRHTYVFDASNRCFCPSRGANDTFLAAAAGVMATRCKLNGFLKEEEAVQMLGFNLMDNVEVNGKLVKLIHCINPKSGWVWNDKYGGKDHIPMVTIVRRTGEGENEKILLKFNCVDNFRQYL